MSGFDPSLDVKSFEKGVNVPTGELIVSVHSYNGGAKKLQISRKKKDKEDNLKFDKLGRVSKEEVQALSTLFSEAYSQM